MCCPKATSHLAPDCHWRHDELQFLASILSLIHCYLRFHALYQKDKFQDKFKLCIEKKLGQHCKPGCKPGSHGL